MTLMAAEDYGIVSSDFSVSLKIPSHRHKMQKHLSSRSATFVKVLKRHRIRNTFHGNTFSTNEHRANAVYTKISRYWDSTRQRETATVIEYALKGI